MDQRRHYDVGPEFTTTVATNYRGTSLLRARLRRRCAARRTIYSTPLNRRARPLEILPWRGGGGSKGDRRNWVYVGVYVAGAAGKEEEKVGRYKLHRAVDEARSKLGKLSSPCIGPVPGYTPL